MADRARASPGPRWRWPGCSQKPVVTAPIVGATKPDHLDDAIGAADVELSPEEIEQLEAPYEPHRIAGH